jgi:lysophospholipase L1-like esterase
MWYPPDIEEPKGKPIMKTLNVVLAVSFLLLTSIVSFAEKPTALKVVCFGDSVTGVYYHTGGRRAYTDMVKIGLKKTYPEATITTINAGISGNTTSDALRRIQKDVLKHKPDIVTIMFGLNDMKRSSLDDYRTNLRTIVTKCQAIDAQVILCTPNSIHDTSARPTAKLEQYVAIVRELAKELNLPLADCYANYQEIREEDSLEWAFLMSDEIHPNMDGHKRIAESITQTITGKSISLMDVPALLPKLPHIRKLIAKRKPINILAMPPYDTIAPVKIKQLAPESALTITPWEVEGKTLAQIEVDSKEMVRGKNYDLVILAVPIEATADSPEAFIQSYSWILNNSLSFGYQEWDVVAAHPSMFTIPEGDAAQRDEWAKKLIRAQDFELLIPEHNQGLNVAPKN